MNAEHRAKREELKAMSAGYRVLVKNGAIASVNEGLAKLYASQGHTTLKSYRRWKEDGFQVRKGSKALLLWGEPKGGRHKDKEPPKEGEEEKAEFFPVAFMFSNLQVDKM